jgi:acyl-CoA synthetase (AMP-forming)/AMP-acid ligase II
MGDIGAVDPVTGHLRIRSRTKETIITGGLNVYPREVEIMLEEHPAAAEVAVAGVPDERWGEQMAAGWCCGTGTRSAKPFSSPAPGRGWPGTSAPSGCTGGRPCPRSHVGKIAGGVLS